MRSIFKYLRSAVPDRHPFRLAWHYVKAFIAALIYGFPARKLTVIGVTGTDGKTTTVGMIHHILQSAGRSVGSASTAFLQIGEEREENESHLTSLSPFVLQRFLRRLVRSGGEYAVIEASSHGLVQGRLNHTYPLVAAITNVTSEHLDYHGTLDKYRADKGKLFEMLGGRGVKVLNAGDESFELYSKILSEETIIYESLEGREGREGAVDLWLSDICVNESSTSAILHTGDDEFELKLNVPGKFNLENALCAIACATSVGIPLQICVDALQVFEALPGRLERIDEGQDFHVFVDFAVSSNSYKQTLQALRSIVMEDGRVMVLCSSCGNRMKERRPQIGKIVSELSDVVVVTEDETYGEDPIEVLEAVWSGVDQSITEAHKITDRREGIEFLLKNATKGDAVVVCGMGPFTTMTRLEGRVEWDEREIVREILKRGRR